MLFNIIYFIYQVFSLLLYKSNAQNFTLLQYLYAAALTFFNLSYNTTMERTPLIFLAPLIYLFWYLVASWDFTLLHQHKKNMAPTWNFFYSLQRPTQGEFFTFFSSFQQFSLFTPHLSNLLLIIHLHTLNGFKYSEAILTIQFNINDLFAQSLII